MPTIWTEVDRVPRAPIARELYLAARTVWRSLHQKRKDRVVRVLVRHYGAAVLTGPFAGMRWLPDRARFCPPRLVGSYESELHPFIEACIARDYRHVINIGCAEGYYAVGLALRLPRAAVYALDIDPAAREWCRETARLNGVAERVHVVDDCDHAALTRLPLHDALVVCDCDGGEGALLDPDVVRDLRATDLLVELHDFIVPGTSEALKARFSSTHDIQIVTDAPRDPATYSQLWIFRSSYFRRLALDEFRPFTMRWASIMRKAWPRLSSNPQ